MLPNLDDLSTAAWLYDFDNFRIHWANKAAIALWEADSLEELCARDFAPETSAAVREALDFMKADLAAGQQFQRVWQLSPKGHSKDVFCRFSAFYLHDRVLMLCEGTPVQLLEDYAEMSASVNLSTFSMEGKFHSANPSFRAEMPQRIEHLKDLFCEPELAQRLTESLRDSARFEQDLKLHTGEGPKWFQALAIKSVDQHNKASILLQLVNIHLRKTRELVLTEASLLDPLTELFNRRGLKQQLALLTEKNRRLILFYIDLDGFKIINDTFGHAIGDELLKAVAKRLRDEELKCGLAGRIGGDEFIWASFEDQLPCEEHLLAAKLVSALSETYYTRDKHPLTVSASVGIAHFPDDGISVDELIVSADTAMYFAKQRGKRRYMHFTAGMETDIRRRSFLVQHLHKAIAHEELSLHYQSIVDGQTSRVVAFEALLRWKNKSLGQVPPIEAIKAAEDSGIIGEIEKCVFSRGIADLTQLRKTAGSHVKLSLNLSGRHIQDAGLIPFLLAQLQKAQLKPADLWIELTESVLLDTLNRDNNPVNALADLGFAISIDDFGTGFSSLAYLHSLPASTVKLDRSFIARLPSSETTIRYVHNLVKSLGMKTVAEGVETSEQKTALAKLGIDLQQGYLHARPRSLQDILKPH